MIPPSRIFRPHHLPLDTLDLLHPAGVAASLELAGQPDLDDLLSQLDPQHAPAKGQDVAVVMLPGHPRCVRFMAEGRADARHLVGDDTAPDPGAADDDAAFNLPLGYRLRDLARVVRVVHGLQGVRPHVLHLVSEGLQERFQLLLEEEPCVVAADGNSHVIPSQEPGPPPEPPGGAQDPGRLRGRPAVPGQ